MQILFWSESGQIDNALRSRAHFLNEQFTMNGSANTVQQEPFMEHQAHGINIQEPGRRGI
jgi:hypothetical protein